MGDSITEGLKWQKKEVYTSYIEKWTKVKANNYGYRATKIAREEGIKDDFNYRVKYLDPKADFTFIFGGTNDYSLGHAELGEPNSDSLYTFYGAVKNLIKELLIMYKKEQICFILPLPRYDENKIIKTAPLSSFRSIIKEECTKNEIEYLDLSNTITIPITDGKSEYFKDGLHPNKKGHKLVASCIINYLYKKGLIKELPEMNL